MSENLSQLTDVEVVRLRAAVEAEMRKREIATNIGQMGEELAIQYFNNTPGCPNLSPAPIGTAYVDALSRRGERYSIKTLCRAKKTGTIYPDREDDRKQLFEYLLIVKLSGEWALEAIYEFDWPTFLEHRKWDKTMNAWYLGTSRRTLASAKLYTVKD